MAGYHMNDDSSPSSLAFGGKAAGPTRHFSHQRVAYALLSASERQIGLRRNGCRYEAGKCE